jgi:translation initiation factor 2 subunit 2
MSDNDNDNDPPPSQAEEEETDVAAMLDLTSKKKKKKKKTKQGASEKSSKSSTTKTTTDTATTTATPSSSSNLDFSQQQALLLEQDQLQEQACGGSSSASSSLYTYEELLDRVVTLLNQHNPDLVDKKRRNIKPPQLTLLSSKKTLWINFQEICTMMGRDPSHVYAFFMAELGTEGSIDGNQRLIIRGKYVPKYIESLLRKYVVEYVTCEMCRSPNTELNRDQSSRLYFLTCKDCGSSRSVAPIKSGYHATSRADRRAARNAKG